MQTVQLAVGVLADLLQYSAMLPELSREVGLNWVLGVLTSLLGLQAEVPDHTSHPDTSHPDTSTLTHT